jgi:hypothetical protein
MDQASTDQLLLTVQQLRAATQRSNGGAYQRTPVDSAELGFQVAQARARIDGLFHSVQRAAAEARAWAIVGIVVMSLASAAVLAWLAYLFKYTTASWEGAEWVLKVVLGVVLWTGVMTAAFSKLGRALSEHRQRIASVKTLRSQLQTLRALQPLLTFAPVPAGKQLPAGTTTSVMSALQHDDAMQSIEAVLSKEPFANMSAVRRVHDFCLALMVETVGREVTDEQVRAAIRDKVVPLLSRKLHKFRMTASLMPSSAPHSFPAQSQAQCLQACALNGKCAGAAFAPGTNQCKLVLTERGGLATRVQAGSDIVYLTDDVSAAAAVRHRALQLGDALRDNVPDIDTCLRDCFEAGSPHCTFVALVQGRCHKGVKPVGTTQLARAADVSTYLVFSAKTPSAAPLLLDATATVSTDIDLYANLIAQAFHDLGPHGPLVTEHTETIRGLLGGTVIPVDLLGRLLAKADEALLDMRRADGELRHLRLVSVSAFVSALDELTMEQLLQGLDVNGQERRVSELMAEYTHAASAATTTDRLPLALLVLATILGVLLFAQYVVSKVATAARECASTNPSCAGGACPALLRRCRTAACLGVTLDAPLMDKLIGGALLYLLPASLVVYLLAVLWSTFARRVTTVRFNDRILVTNTSRLHERLQQLRAFVHSRRWHELSADEARTRIGVLPSVMDTDKAALYELLKQVLFTADRCNLVSKQKPLGGPTFPFATVSANGFMLAGTVACIFVVLQHFAPWQRLVAIRDAVLALRQFELKVSDLSFLNRLRVMLTGHDASMTVSSKSMRLFFLTMASFAMLWFTFRHVVPSSTAYKASLYNSRYYDDQQCKQ